MSRTRLATRLVGRSRRLAGRALLAAVGLAVGLWLLRSHAGAAGAGLFVGGGLAAPWFALLAAAAALSHANDGVVPSLVLGVVPLVGLFAGGGVATVGEPTLRTQAGFVLQAACLYGVPAGGLGYLVGRGIRLAESPPDEEAPTG